MDENTKQNVDGLGPLFGASPAGAMANKDSRLQVDLGNYTLRIGDEICGELWVEYDPSHPDDKNRTIEHWMLYANYVTPSSVNRDVRIQLVYQEGRYRNLRDFVARNLDKPSTKYIQAMCVVMNPSTEVAKVAR